MEQIIKESIYKHLEDNNNQHAVVKNKSCQTNLASFFDRVTGLVNSSKQQMGFLLILREDFDIVSHCLTD